MADVAGEDTYFEQLNRQLFLTLVTNLSGDPLVTLQNTPEQNGLEAWRRLFQHYDEPSSRARRRQQMTTLLQPVPAKSLADTIHTIERWEAEMSRITSRFGIQIDPEIRSSTLLTLAPTRLQ